MEVFFSFSQLKRFGKSDWRRKCKIIAAFLLGFDNNDSMESGFLLLSSWLCRLLHWHDGFVASRSRKFLGFMRAFIVGNLGEREDYKSAIISSMF